MVDGPRVSVVAPVYNNAPYLDRCITSLLGQRGVGGTHEVILIDNGSTDGSIEIAEKYPEVTLLHEGKRGAYPARNAGLRRAAASVIAFTDGDCEADPDWLRAALEEMEDPTTAIAVGYCRYPRDGARSLRLLEAYENAKAEYVLSRCARSYHFGYTNNMAVQSSVFEELGMFLEWRRAGDSELVHRVAAKRPHLRTVFSSAMRVTHLEFRKSSPRLRRLKTYTQTNAKIETFRELGAAQRAGVLWHMLQRTLAGGGR